MLEAHRIRSAQLKVEAAQKKADRARKILDAGHDTLSPEKKERLEQLVAAADSMAKTPPIPTTGPIFASSKGTPLNMNNVLNRQILRPCGRQA